MKLPGALVLLGAALLLTSGGDCDICPAIKEDIDLLLGQSVSDYVGFVERYSNSPAVLENAENLKKCVDSKLTQEDKESIQSLVLEMEPVFLPTTATSLCIQKVASPT
ncbi:major allergen I polypeptide chain 1-like [Cricetulus griseus]|uniref:Major allergen I polypeptide chain 1-like n=2 Tax=Cricetulus griseus TaxID=10029 RepID=A0A9J7GHL8_CRIGR|nr:major allergen I polypeptide chain 1-like [Cricetulus griseus]XP_035314736.1 major allergen I polypeptide chain 1-like [Cricetulus griseus]